MDTTSVSDEGKPTQPSPAHIEEFLPWACNQLQVNKTILVTKIAQTDYVSVVGTDRSKGKKGKGKGLSKVELTLDMDKDDKSFTTMPVISTEDFGLQIFALYDSSEHLVQLKFERTSCIERMIFKIIGLIIQFHPFFNSLIINGGIDQYGVYEIRKFLPISNITEICLDNTFLVECNFHILLEETCFLRHLSLARCSINDDVVERIASTITYPLPASRMLSILNLSSNKITDLGAKYLSEALRSNRQLSYLNLSSNMLTDTGADQLFSSLLKFPLTFAELLASRARHMTYLKQKNELILLKVKELRAGDFDKRSARKKSVKPVPITKKDKKGPERESSLKSVPDAKSFGNIDGGFMEKASLMAEAVLGEFKDPFDSDNTISSDKGIVYSQGNNSLSYISLAYNNLSYMTITKLLKVLSYQKETGRKPRGLVNVSIEGNLMPVTCKELQLIDDILDTGLILHTRRYSLTTKKRAQMKVPR